MSDLNEAEQWELAKQKAKELWIYVVAGVAMVLSAVVDDLEACRQEGFLQQDFDLACDGSAHRRLPGLFIGALYYHYKTNAPTQVPRSIR